MSISIIIVSDVRIYYKNKLVIIAKLQSVVITLKPSGMTE